MKIAVILTCHNRCIKTVASLTNLYASVLYYNANTKESIDAEIFLTDDGCTDNTVEEVHKAMDGKLRVNIIVGDGNRFWAGGMRDAWNEALKREWDYFLLLNDDTLMKESAFVELFDTHKYCIDKFGKAGLYSGITCATDEDSEITYSGDVWTNKFLCKTRRLSPTGEPQTCDMTNANILLVPDSVVKAIGIFDTRYQHAIADYDYSMTAVKHKIPVLVTGNACGICDNDHPDADVVDRACAMTLNEREKLYNSPRHSISDYMYFVRRFTPLRYPMVYVGRKMLIYFPHIYRFLYRVRVK